MLQLTVAGNIGKDAELKEYNGRMVISFSVAVTESYTNAEQQKVDKTIWVSCSQWKEKGAKTNIVKYLTKGTKVIVQGRPNVNTYRDNQNNFQASLQLRVDTIELMGSAADRQQQNNSQAPAAEPSNSSPAYQQQPHEITEPMDDLPF